MLRKCTTYTVRTLKQKRKRNLSRNFYETELKYLIGAQTVPNNTITEDWVDITLATISNCDLLYFRLHRNENHVTGSVWFHTLLLTQNNYKIIFKKKKVGDAEPVPWLKENHLPTVCMVVNTCQL